MYRKPLENPKEVLGLGVGDLRFRIADCGLRPPARRGHRAYAPEGLRIGGIAMLYQL